MYSSHADVKDNLLRLELAYVQTVIIDKCYEKEKLFGFCKYMYLPYVSKHQIDLVVTYIKINRILGNASKRSDQLSTYKLIIRIIGVFERTAFIPTPYNLAL